MKKLILIILLLSSIKLYSQELIQFRLSNTLMKTNRVTVCKAYINEKDHILTLKSISSPQVFKILYQGDGIHMIEFYLNGKLEATKTIYRRKDIETGNGTQIYTSRTGEITITLSTN